LQHSRALAEPAEDTQMANLKACLQVEPPVETSAKTASQAVLAREPERAAELHYLAERKHRTQVRQQEQGWEPSPVPVLVPGQASELPG